MRNYLFTFLCLVFTATIITAQTDTTSKEEVAPVINWEVSTAKGNAVIGAFGEIVYTKPVKKEPTTSKKFFSTADKLPNDFTGYSVQIMARMDPLPANDEVFAKYGGIMLEEMSNPKYCYLLGQFKTFQGAKQYLSAVIQYTFPNAKIIRYKKGKRIRVKGE